MQKWPILLKLFYVLFILKGKFTVREEMGEKKMFHLLIPSPDGHSFQSCGVRAQGVAAFPHVLARGWIRSRHKGSAR